MSAATYVWLGTTSSAWPTNTNWSSSGPPTASSDAAVFDYNGVSANGVAGSDQSTTTLTQLDITSTYTLAFGDNATPLKVKSAIINIGAPSGSATAGAHSGRINIDASTVNTTITVF